MVSLDLSGEVSLQTLIKRLKQVLNHEDINERAFVSLIETKTQNMHEFRLEGEVIGNEELLHIKIPGVLLHDFKHVSVQRKEQLECFSQH